ncbi:MAG: response regulator [Myxococcota bacterium]|nr:response regulator [Myxococcota bacterium]
MSGVTALIGRFLATASERLTQMGEVLSTLRGSGDVNDVVKRIGRDLHTLKGEARLLGLPEIERVAHASEDMLFSHHRAQQITEFTEQLLYEAIDIIFTCVQARGEGVSVSEAEIEAVVKRLRDNVLPETRASAPTQQQPPEHDDGLSFGDDDIVLAQPIEQTEAKENKPEAKTPEPKPEGDDGDRRQGGGRTMHVATALLDNMTDEISNLSGSLVRNRQYLARLTTMVDDLRELMRATGEGGEAQDPVERAAALEKIATLPGRITTELREFREHHFRLDLSFSELSEHTREARLQALRSVFAGYPSFVRNVARQEGKRIRVETSGEELGIDQRVLDEIGEPCLHLLRNSVVHGIETPEERRRSGKREEGLVSIHARQDGELVRIEFSDDGRGIDVDRVRRRAIAMGTIDEEHASRLNPEELARLVFTSGLSTAATTTELAGRGVGLDVVSTVIDRMGGTVTLETIHGVGTKFVLQVPVSLSLTRALFLETADQTFAVPNAAVVEVYRLPVREIRTIEGRETTSFRGKLLPLVRLREALGLKGIKDIFVNKVGVVVLRSGDDMAGFVVDNLIGEREIVARPFGHYVGRAYMASGVTLMENGDVVLILHPPDLLRSLHDTKRTRGAAGEARADGSERRILYAEDSIITREYAAGVLRSRGFQVVEASDGVEAFERLQVDRFDLLLTDLQMPRMDGFKLCAQVRKDPRLKNLPIVVMSTLDTPETKRMALDAGADAYLVKSSFAADTLISTIGHVIR